MKIIRDKYSIASVFLVATLSAAIFGLVAATLQNPALEPHLPMLFLVNVSGVIVLAGLLIVYGYRLYRRLRLKEPGTGLTIRMIRGYALLMLVSIILFYFFSYFALNRSVDGSINIRIDKALQDAVQLGTVSVDAWKDSSVYALDELGSELAVLADPDSIARLINAVREARDLTEIVYFREYESPASAIVASDIQLDTLRVPRIDETMLSQVAIGEPVWRPVVSDDGALQWRLLMKFPIQGTVEHFYLQALTTLPASYRELGESIESARQEYSGFLYLVDSLRFNLVLALTFVAMFLLMLSIWIAIVFSQRLVRPIKTLSEGTRAVAGGNYEKQLVVESSDDIGVLVNSFNDMTNEIKSAHDRVQKSQARAEEQRTYLETVLRHLSTGVVLIDAHNRVIDVNLAAEEILKLRRVEIEGKTLDELTEAVPMLMPLCTFITDGAAAGKMEWNSTLSIHSNVGRLSWTCSVTRLPEADEGFGRFVLVIEDISLLVKAQRVSAWGEVSQRFAHEVCNPLTPIQLSVERIHMKTLDALPQETRPSVERAFSAIFRQLHSMRTIVDEFRDYAKITQLNPTLIQLNDVVRDIAELHNSGDKDTVIDVDLGEDVGRIHADPDRMVQVLNNLIINSSHAMRDVSDARIGIRTRRAPADFVEIRFNDNGPGFDPSILNKVFEPYATTKEKGTGLGLAIVQRIVTEHGGTVEARNSEHGGAEIIIRLSSHSTAGKNDKAGSFEIGTTGAGI